MKFNLFLFLFILLGNLVADELTIPQPTDFTIYSSKCIGDFDNDENLDILVMEDPEIGKHWAVYSYIKGEYLLEVNGVGTDIEKIEIIPIGSSIYILSANKIYYYSEGLASLKK